MAEALGVLLLIVLGVLAVAVAIVFWLPFGWIAILLCVLGLDSPGLGTCDGATIAIVVYSIAAVVVAVVYPRTIIAKLHYWFAPHPAEDVVTRSRGTAEDHKALAEKIERSGSMSEEGQPASFVSENMARKAAKLAAATRRRRAEKELLEEHERLVRETKR